MDRPFLARVLNNLATRLHHLSYTSFTLLASFYQHRRFPASISYHIATMSPIGGSAKDAQKESTLARVLGAGMYRRSNAIVSIAQTLTTS